MAARPDPTVALSIRELREPNEFDLELLREEGAEYGAVRARGARVVAERPKLVVPPTLRLEHPARGAPEATEEPPARRIPRWGALAFGALTLASAVTTWLLLTAR